MGDNRIGMFETTAAFNVESIAVAYAEDCAKTNPSYQYRVRKGKKVTAFFQCGVGGRIGGLSHRT